MCKSITNWKSFTDAGVVQHWKISYHHYIITVRGKYVILSYAQHCRKPPKIPNKWNHYQMRNTTEWKLPTEGTMQNIKHGKKEIIRNKILSLVKESILQMTPSIRWTDKQASK